MAPVTRSRDNSQTRDTHHQPPLNTRPNITPETVSRYLQSIQEVATPTGSSPSEEPPHRIRNEANSPTHILIHNAAPTSGGASSLYFTSPPHEDEVLTHRVINTQTTPSAKSCLGTQTTPGVQSSSGVDSFVF